MGKGREGSVRLLVYRSRIGSVGWWPNGPSVLFFVFFCFYSIYIIKNYNKFKNNINTYLQNKLFRDKFYYLSRLG
jgi:hypothetical protein